MKKVLFFALILLAAVSCKKNETVDDGDPRSKFVGDYNLVIKATVYPTCDNSTIAGMLPTSKDLTTKTLDLKIEKDPETDNKVIISGFYECKALVSGDNLMLESSKGKEYFKLIDFIDTDQSWIKTLIGDTEIPLEYTQIHDVATLSGNKLTWHTEGEGSYTMELGTFGSITFSAKVSADNTATKK